MPVADLVFQRTIDLPPVIVWDALVDGDLLGGWLGEVELLPAADSPGGIRFRLVWPGADARQSTTGTVLECRPAHRLRVDTDNRGLLDFSLVAVPGGSRGSGTELGLRVKSAVEAAFAARVEGEWQTSLDRLELLLRGHPVDWARLEDQSDGTTGVGGTSARSVNSPD